MARSDYPMPRSVAQVSLRKHALPGRLIAICGTDGSGKSTAIGLLKAALIDDGIAASEVVELQQPSSWWRSDPHVRRTMHKQGDAAEVDEFALGVFGVADRLNQQVQVIEPALAAGRTVLMDRYVFCLLAYFMAKGEPNLDYLASICQPLFEPDITFVLDCPAQVAVGRVVDRDGPSSGRYDQQIDRTTAIIGAYRSIAHSNGLPLLSSLDPPGAVLTRLLETLREHDGSNASWRASQE